MMEFTIHVRANDLLASHLFTHSVGRIVFQLGDVNLLFLFSCRIFEKAIYLQLKFVFVSGNLLSIFGGGFPCEIEHKGNEKRSKM